MCDEQAILQECSSECLSYRLRGQPVWIGEHHFGPIHVVTRVAVEIFELDLDIVHLVDLELQIELSGKEYFFIMIKQKVSVWGESARGRNGDTLKPTQELPGR